MEEAEEEMVKEGEVMKEGEIKKNNNYMYIRRASYKKKMYVQSMNT